MSPTYVLGIDQGSSGSRALLLDAAGQARGYGYQPVGRLYPQPGWVEQEPHAIAASVRVAVEQALAQAGCAASEVVACGAPRSAIRSSPGMRPLVQPIGNAITWQDLAHSRSCGRDQRLGACRRAARAAGPVPRPLLLGDAYGLAHAPRSGVPARGSGRATALLARAWLAAPGTWATERSCARLLAAASDDGVRLSAQAALGGVGRPPGHPARRAAARGADAASVRRAGDRRRARRSRRRAGAGDDRRPAGRAVWLRLPHAGRSRLHPWHRLVCERGRGRDHPAYAAR